MKSYIGPAQVTPGATLRTLRNPVQESPCLIDRSVDAALLKDLSAQNILALVYLHLLYEPRHRPNLMILLKSVAGVGDLCVIYGLHRVPCDGDVAIHLAPWSAPGKSNSTVMLSDVRLIEDFTDGPIPDYVLEELGRTVCGASPDDDTPEADALARQRADGKTRGDETPRPNPYLRHPLTRETFLPMTHTEFFRLARGYAPLPEPFAVEAGGSIILLDAAVTAGK